ncbi:PAS domain-containing protein [Massilia sp. TS11]|uniref:PAS domain-containing protein n=1 Tax=Massilia sp. TS11 TaxID=2908003 RepID=UPI001EDC322B|nr:PAS domain-containing protein [Massilia sp. TS11]MCG2584006.1 PAS domain-containing protein [Massilia sp. TS11]
MNSSTSNDLVIEEDDLPASLAPQADAPWRVLIVDDDVDVHVVTKFALSNASYQGRRISFLHAYTGKEALLMLEENPDVALVLLDVIMESDDAGLQVARKIRTELDNELVRIVLRTGQPGQALEHSIIVDYDINDFWCKADLTTRKLFTTVISALRAYATLAAAAATRDALRATLDRMLNLQAALDLHAVVLHINSFGRLIEVNPKACELTGLAREQMIGKDLPQLLPHAFTPGMIGNILKTVSVGGHWQGDFSGRLRADGPTLSLRTTVYGAPESPVHGHEYILVATVCAEH